MLVLLQVVVTRSAGRLPAASSMHRREVVTVRVRLGEAEPLVRHEVDVRARVLAVEVERHDQALLHETVVRPQRLEREEI